ncbi:hypothetical protein C7M71_007400 [Peterkaempfera bronchialis]|uniref:Uncharacterized protein n=1 Tax=Peterkaempfera bronchialis TaxID=2126346 RepID=A0A345SU88_9ACTN|nr:hypothetical protein C7M71_007400 [Peterkaempfera bronchialis]
MRPATAITLLGAVAIHCPPAADPPAMFPRAAAAAQASAQGLALCFAADAPRGIVDFFTGMERGER